MDFSTRKNRDIAKHPNMEKNDIIVPLRNKIRNEDEGHVREWRCCINQHQASLPHYLSETICGVDVGQDRCT